MKNLERDLAIEEAWAARAVMEPVTNEARLDDFHAKKALFHCVSEVVTNRCEPCATKAQERVVRRLNFRPRPSNNRNPLWMA